MGAFDPYTPLSNVDALRVRPLSSSPSAAPIFTLHREGLAAVDAADYAPTKASAGMNMHGFEKAIIQVVSKADDPIANIEVLTWSQDAGKFVPYATAKAANSPGAGKNYAYECEAEGQIIFVRMTGTCTGADRVDILVAGDNVDHHL